MKKPVLDLTRISKYMSLILRHKPEAIGIELDAHGWANVDALLAGIGRKYAIDRGVLEEIVRTDGKQRYSFNADRTMIRANQGHSIPVDVELPTAEPPETLFHGTAERFAASIEAQGLRPKSRLYVHLSSNAWGAGQLPGRGQKNAPGWVYLLLVCQWRVDDENGSSSISEKIREVNTLCIAYGNGMQPLECTPFFRQIFRIAMMIWLATG